jgi:hypothetical protein
MPSRGDNDELLNERGSLLKLTLGDWLGDQWSVEFSSQNSRCGIYDTQAAFACVGDADNDTGKPFAANIPASALVETSPNNEHRLFFLKHAIGPSDAIDLGPHDADLRRRCVQRQPSAAISTCRHPEFT